MMRILIIEDERDVSNVLVEILEQAGFEPVTAYDGAHALTQLSTTYDLVLLDLTLPFVDGETILAQLRQQSTIPVIIISAKNATTTKVELLRLGADDYITKPFDIEEVVARIESTLRRAYGPAVTRQKRYTYQTISLDEAQQLVTLANRTLALTATEYALLHLFMSQPQKIFTKENLIRSLRDDGYTGDEGTIKTHISNLRHKLQPIDAIETIRYLGYRLRPLS